MATSNQDTNIKDVPAPASATPTNIGHILGLNAAKTQDVLIPLSMLRTVIAAELKTALAAITSGSPDVPVLDGNNLKYMTLANFAKVVGGQRNAITANTHIASLESGWYTFAGFKPKGAPSALGYSYGHVIVHRAGDFRLLFIYANETAACYIAYTFGGSANLTKWLQLSGTLVTDLIS